MTGTVPMHAFAPGRHSDDVFALHEGQCVTFGRFLADSRALACRLRGMPAVVNLCEDRYRFIVGYAAALFAGATTLLPPSRNPTAVSELQARHPGVPAMGDRLDSIVTIAVGPAEDATAVEPVTAVPADQTAAVLHTSGSTGEPTPNTKTWGSLVQGAQRVAERLQPRPGSMMVATVPPQHMYGLEASVMLPLQTGCAVAAGQPMFPGDVRAALAATDAPRVLVTTPVHLRAFMESAVSFPAVDWVVSSTAPLDADLAARAEARFDAPVHEIYGSTETGAMATRRTARESDWNPVPGFAFDFDGEHWWASAPHLAEPVALGDLLEQHPDGRFALAGRRAELVKIAGKRASLGALNQRLLAVEGVVDGVFYAPGGEHAGTVKRLAAFVVAPERSERDILSALREVLDPVFVPRPLVRLEALPRNEAGKLPRQRLEALAERYLK